MLKIKGIYRENNTFNQIQRYFILLKKDDEFFYGYDLDFSKKKDSISRTDILNELQTTSLIDFHFWKDKFVTIEKITDGYLGKLTDDIYEILCFKLQDLITKNYFEF